MGRRLCCQRAGISGREQVAAHVVCDQLRYGADGRAHSRRARLERLVHDHRERFRHNGREEDEVGGGIEGAHLLERHWAEDLRGGRVLAETAQDGVITAAGDDELQAVERLRERRQRVQNGLRAFDLYAAAGKEQGGAGLRRGADLGDGAGELIRGRDGRSSMPWRTQRKRPGA